MPKIIVPLFTAISLLLPSLHAQSTVRLHGRVVDLKSGEPLAKALVSVHDQRLATVTDASGMFTLDGVRPGDVEVYLGAAGYPLVKKNLTVPAAADFEVEIQFGQKTLKRHD